MFFQPAIPWPVERKGRGGYNTGMNIFLAMLLGLVQGLCEFLPVSSSGHLVLLQTIFGVEEGALFFTTMLHVGTLLAVFAVYWRQIWEMLRRPIQKKVGMLLLSTAVTTLPILRPVVGMDKEEIVRIARKINTFETSILPYEDCCTVFTPRHPKTKPSVEETREYESALDVEGLCQRAMAGREMIRIKPTL
mgnify:CR=1 FL=1